MPGPMAAQPVSTKPPEIVEWPTKPVRLSKIDPNPWNPNRMTKDGMEKLRKAILDKGIGILGHLVVRPKKGGRYELVDGEHRYEILKELGVIETDAIVADLDDDKAKVAGLLLNELRGQPDFKLLSEEVKGLADRHGIEELAAQLPWRESVIRRLAEAYQGTEQGEGQPWLAEGPGTRIAVSLPEDAYDALMGWAGKKGIHEPGAAVLALIREEVQDAGD